MRLLVLLSFVLLLTQATAANVRIAWDPVPGPGVLGYYLHWGKGNVPAQAVNTVLVRSTNVAEYIVTLKLGQGQYIALMQSISTNWIPSDPSPSLLFMVTGGGKIRLKQ
jgi:hypothetical protein